MSTYSLINDGDSGLSVRTTLNAVLQDANDGVFTGATGPQGPQGDTGPQGPQGATGSSAPAGLVNGTGANSLKQDNALTTTDAVASGVDSIALGTGAQGIGAQGIAIGNGANALNGSDCIAIGRQAVANPNFNNNISIGFSSLSDFASVAIGFDTTATGQLNTTIGTEATATGNN